MLWFPSLVLIHSGEHVIRNVRFFFLTEQKSRFGTAPYERLNTGALVQLGRPHMSVYFHELLSPSDHLTLTHFEAFAVLISRCTSTNPL